MAPSKTIQLGVIVLALELLRNLKVPGLRVLSFAARALGVSRKAGYEAARRLREAIGRPERQASDRDRREITALRIQNQILRFERDHPDVRFERDSGHLTPEARSLAVRLLRDFRDQLSLDDLAALIGLPPSNLRRWDATADEDCGFPEKPERRGKHRRAGPEDVRKIEEAYKGLAEPATLEEFTERYNRQNPERPMDRRTITRVLQRLKLVEVSTRDPRPAYHTPFRVYFPGAQVALDAKEFQVIFDGPNEETVRVTKEFAIDIASLAIVGEAIGKEETSDGVERVIVQARTECASLLSILADNGTANRSDEIRRLTGTNDLQQVFTFPYHPETNGHLEGMHGQIARNMGEIHLDTSSRERLAESVVEVVTRIYAHFHNFSPRGRLGGKSPVEYLRGYAPRPEEMEEARKEIEKQRKRSEALRRPNPRLEDPGFQTLLDRVLCLGLGVSSEDATQALLRYDDLAIERARNAFVIQSQRDGFDKQKHNFAYFVGIVRNKQRATDVARLKTEIGIHNTAEQVRRTVAEREQIRREEAEEKVELQRRPEDIILRNADMLARGGLRFARDRWIAGLRQGLEALRALGRLTEVGLDRLAAAIRSWAQYAEETKDKVVAILTEEFQMARSPP